MANYYNNYPPPPGGPGIPQAGPPPQNDPNGPPSPMCVDGEGGCCIAVGGICQCILGLLSIIFGAVILSNALLGEVLNIYIPIWGGTMFLLAGMLGIAIVCCPGDQGCNKCLVIGYIIMSVVAFIVALGQVAWEGWVAALFQIPVDLFCSGILGVVDDVFNIIGLGCDDSQLVYYMHIGAAVVAGIELIVALVSSILGCIRCCSSPATQYNNTTVVVGAPANGLPPAYAAQGPSPYGPQGPSPYGPQGPSPYSVQQPGGSSAYYNKGYGQNPSVYYSGQRAMFQPQGYM